MVLYMNSNSLALYALLVVAAVCGQNDPVAPTTTSGRRPWTASFARTFDVTASGQNDTVAPTTISTRTAPKSMRLPLARTAPSARSSDATATRTESARIVPREPQRDEYYTLDGFCDFNSPSCENNSFCPYDLDGGTRGYCKECPPNKGLCSATWYIDLPDIAVQDCEALCLNENADRYCDLESPSCENNAFCSYDFDDGTSGFCDDCPANKALCSGSLLTDNGVQECEAVCLSVNLPGYCDIESPCEDYNAFCSYDFDDGTSGFCNDCPAWKACSDIIPYLSDDGVQDCEAVCYPTLIEEYCTRDSPSCESYAFCTYDFDECRDYADECEGWSNDGDCDNPLYRDEMLLDCPLACDVCDEWEPSGFCERCPPPNKACSDIDLPDAGVQDCEAVCLNGNIDGTPINGYCNFDSPACENNAFCNYDFDECRDYDDECEDRSNDGDCDNPLYRDEMLLDCPLTCDVCDEWEPRGFCAECPSDEACSDIIPYLSDDGVQDCNSVCSIAPPFVECQQNSPCENKEFCNYRFDDGTSGGFCEECPANHDFCSDDMDLSVAAALDCVSVCPNPRPSSLFAIIYGELYSDNLATVTPHGGFDSRTPGTVYLWNQPLLDASNINSKLIPIEVGNEILHFYFVIDGYCLRIGPPEQNAVQGYCIFTYTAVDPNTNLVSGSFTAQGIIVNAIVPGQLPVLGGTGVMTGASGLVDILPAEVDENFSPPVLIQPQAGLDPFDEVAGWDHLFEISVDKLFVRPKLYGSDGGTCESDSRCGKYSVARVTENGNTALGAYSTTGGGQGNAAGGAPNPSDVGFRLDGTFPTHAVVGGGDGNKAIAPKSVIAGGYKNMLSFARVEKNYVLSFLVTEDGAATANEYCAISGGTENGSVNMTENGSVFLRSVNSATRASAITGGVMNKFMDTEKNALMVISGGMTNFVDGKETVVSGGQYNAAGSKNSVVLGGQENAALGKNSAVAGGYKNSAYGRSSIAMGKRAYVNETHSNSMVINLQGGSQTVASTASGQFLVQAKTFKFQVTNDPGPNNENVFELDQYNIEFLQAAIDAQPTNTIKEDLRRVLHPDKIEQRDKRERDRERRQRKLKAIRDAVRRKGRNTNVEHSA